MCGGPYPAYLDVESLEVMSIRLADRVDGRIALETIVIGGLIPRGRL